MLTPGTKAIEVEIFIFNISFKSIILKSDFLKS